MSGRSGQAFPSIIALPIATVTILFPAHALRTRYSFYFILPRYHIGESSAVLRKEMRCVFDF
jgi:hypothetical protein